MNFRTKRLFVRAFALLAFNTCAQANDSTAELAVGGLVLTHHEGIEMRAEDLFISEKEVRVHYRFYNTATTDTTVLVAFPMPDIEVDGIDFMTAVPTENPENFLDFKTEVDGKAVKARVEQKAFKGGAEQTAKLRSLGVPLQAHLRGTAQALDRLPKAAQEELVKLELAIDEDYDEGKGLEHHLAPTWTLKTTYFWEQTFPARKEIVVTHRYQPSVGGSAQTALEMPGEASSYERFCVDADLRAAAKKGQARAKTDYLPYGEKRISYILTTGANWASPIADFRVVIDKGSPDYLLSFCGDHVRKLSATQFEWRRQDYRPDHDLHILLLTPLPPPTL